MDVASTSSSGASDQENREVFNDPLSKINLDVHVELTPIFSPRRFRCVNKDQAAKLKRLNTRKIEFDADEFVENSQLNTTVNLEESILVSYGS